MPKKSSSKNKTKLSLISRARSASMALAGGTRRKRGGGMEFPAKGVDIHFGPGSYVKYEAPDYKLDATGTGKAGVWRPPNHLPGDVKWWKTVPSNNVPVNAKSGDGYYTTVDTTDKTSATSPGASIANAIASMLKGGRRKRRGGETVKMDIADGGDMKLGLKSLNSNTATAAAAAKGSLAANSARLSCCPTCPKVDITPPSAATSGTSATSNSLNANATGNATVGSSSSLGAQAGNFANSVMGFLKGGAPMSSSNLEFGINKNVALVADYKLNPHVAPSVSDGSSPCCPACPKAPIVAKGGRRKRGGQLELINTALVPGTLLYMQNKYSKKKGFSKMLPKFGGKTRRRRRK